MVELTGTLLNSDTCHVLGWQLTYGLWQLTKEESRYSTKYLGVTPNDP
jgi:hypothetical protein